MNRLFCKLLIVLGICIMTFSCSKAGTDKGIVGSWEIIKIETIALADNSVINTYTTKYEDGTIVNGDVMTPLGANWPNANLTFTDNQILGSFLPYSYKLSGNVIIPSCEWEAKIVSVSSSSLILMAENELTNYKAKYYYSSKPSAKAGSLVGTKWVAELEGDVMTFAFITDEKVSFSVSYKGLTETDTFSGTYRYSSPLLAITLKNGNNHLSLTGTISGNELVFDGDSQNVIYYKQ